MIIMDSFVSSLFLHPNDGLDSWVKLGICLNLVWSENSILTCSFWSRCWCNCSGIVVMSNRIMAHTIEALKFEWWVFFYFFNHITKYHFSNTVLMGFFFQPISFSFCLLMYFNRTVLVLGSPRKDISPDLKPSKLELCDSLVDKLKSESGFLGLFH